LRKLISRLAKIPIRPWKDLSTTWTRCIHVAVIRWYSAPSITVRTLLPKAAWWSKNCWKLPLKDWVQEVRCLYSRSRFSRWKTEFLTRKKTLRKQWKRKISKRQWPTVTRRLISTCY
jgi:NrdD: anaerobic ribonucleoside-triphosphate reductase